MDLNTTGDRGGNFSLTSAGLAVGTSAGTFKTANTLTYVIDGIFYSKNATDNLTFSTMTNPTGGPLNTSSALGNSQEAVYGIWIDSAGTVTTNMGRIVATGQLSSTLGINAAYLPDVLDNKALVGLIKVSTSAAQTFTPGTSTLNSGNTATFYNCRAMPTKPFQT